MKLRGLISSLLLCLLVAGCFVFYGCSKQEEKTPDQPQKNDDSVLDLGDGVRIKLVLIPAGKFTMGSPETEQSRALSQGEVKKRNADFWAEGPKHEATISKPFYMGVYEVTQGQWKAVMGTTVAQQGDKYPPRFPHLYEDDNYPIYYVSWDDVVEFCGKLSEKTGRNVHLPTEAQWEYACRAGSTTRFYFGDDASKLDDYAWYIKTAIRICIR